MKLKLSAKNLRLFLIMALGILVIAVTVILIGALFNNVSKNDTVATVDGIEVSYAEFSLLAEDLKADVVTYFYAEHNVNEGIDFWDKDAVFGGETPLEVLKEKTISAVKEIKIGQQLMIEYEVIEKEDITFDAFLKALESENSRRTEIIEGGGEVYGPEQYTASGYYQYLHNIRLQQLREAIYKKSGSENIEELFGDTLLNETISKRLDNAKIEINDSVYQKINSFS